MAQYSFFHVGSGHFRKHHETFGMNIYKPLQTYVVQNLKYPQY